MLNVNKFAIYFKKFRLKSEFETLKEFAKALANEGWIYKTTIFSHWQSGKRIPKNRKLLINIIKIFVEKGGISSIAEANLFLESANQGYLTHPEKQIFLKKLSTAPFMLPPDINNFVGREKEIALITEKISVNKKILITGMAGVGKTSLAIKLGYLLKNNYPDGILWAKIDKTDPLNILANFFQAYGENIFMVKNLAIRAQMFKTLLTDKHLLIILDNVENEQDLKYLIPDTSSLDIIITARKKTFSSLKTAFKINLQSFSEDESFLFLMKSLGRKNLTKYESDLMRLCKKLGYLPLGISLLTKKIYSFRKQNFKDTLNYLNQNVLNKLGSHEIEISHFFNLNFQILTKKQQTVFTSMAIFNGSDFSIETIVSINDLNIFETTEIIDELFNRSLLEKTKNNRYILHPLIQLFLEKKINHKQILLKKCLIFYLNCYQQQGVREKVHNLQFFAQEVDNLISLLDRFDFNQDWELVKQLWEYFVLTLWDLGLWDKIISLSKKLSKIAKSKNDRLLLVHLYIRDLGILYFQRNEPQINQKNIQEGLILATKLNQKFFIAYAHLRLGMINLQQKRLASAIQQLKVALELFTNLKENGRIGETLCYLAYAYFNQQNLKMAKKLVRQAYRACAQINHQRGQADALSYLAEFYFFEQNYPQALKYFQKSLKIDEKIGRIGQIWIYNIAALAAMELMKVKPATQEQYLNRYLKYNQFAQTVWRVDKLQKYLKT